MISAFGNIANVLHGQLHTWPHSVLVNGQPPVAQGGPHLSPGPPESTHWFSKGGGTGAEVRPRWAPAPLLQRAAPSPHPGPGLPPGAWVVLRPLPASIRLWGPAVPGATGAGQRGPRESRGLASCSLHPPHSPSAQSLNVAGQAQIRPALCKCLFTSRARILAGGGPPKEGAVPLSLNALIPSAPETSAHKEQPH